MADKPSCRLSDAQFERYAAIIAGPESRHDPHAKNPRSSATGLYQFIESTWNRFAQGLPFSRAHDPDASRTVLRASVDAECSRLYRALGHEPTLQQVYMTHFAGGPKGAKIARALEEGHDHIPLAQIIGKRAARKNGALGKMTLGEFAHHIDQKFSEHDPLWHHTPQTPTAPRFMAPAGLDRSSVEHAAGVLTAKATQGDSMTAGTSVSPLHTAAHAHAADPAQRIG